MEYISPSAYILNDNDNDNTKIVLSPMVEQIDMANQKLPITKLEIIDNINYVFSIIGMFSSKNLRKDQFDQYIYSSEDEKSMINATIKGSHTLSIYSPYNWILFHKKNLWKMNCFDIKFETSYNIILYHNLPQIFIIKRSDGSKQQACYLDNHGIVIKKSVSQNDEQYRMYIRAHFYKDQTKEITDTISSFEWNKDFLITDFISENSDFKKLELKFKHFNEEEISSCSDTIKYETMKYYNNLQITWIKTILEPIIMELGSKLEITYSFFDFENI